MPLLVSAGVYAKARLKTGRTDLSPFAATNSVPCANVEIPSENANAQDLAVQ
jgi:hypothetical protein